MRKRVHLQIKKILITAILMLFGLIIFKFYPMFLYDENILFDTSMHIIIASLILYIIYFFIDQNKSWRIPYLIFCFVIITIISIQRIISNAHNDIGILLGILISIISIVIPNWKEIKNKINF
jgi:membrane-associated phospholipid phosphatase